MANMAPNSGPFMLRAGDVRHPIHKRIRPGFGPGVRTGFETILPDLPDVAHKTVPHDAGPDRRTGAAASPQFKLNEYSFSIAKFT